MKKTHYLKTTLAAVMLTVASFSPVISMAQSIKIGNTKIDATKDYADVLGDGKVSYTHADNTLSLKGAEIKHEMTIDNVKGLILKVEGLNSIESSKTGLNLTNGSEITITGDNLKITSSKGHAILVDMQCKLCINNVTLTATGTQTGMSGSVGFMDETVEIDNATVTAEGVSYFAIGDLQSFTAKNVTIVEPEGGAWNPANSRYCDSSNKIAKKVVMQADNHGPQMTTKIAFGQQVVNLTQSSNDVLGDGKVKYDKDEKQFTLDSYTATASIVVEEARGYSFVLKGNNFIETMKPAIVVDKNSDIAFKGDGKLTAVSKDTAAIYIDHFSKLTFADTKISVKGKTGICGANSKTGESLVVDSANVTIMAEDYALANLASFTLLHAKIAKPEEAYWNHDQHKLVDADGNAVKHLVIESRSDNEEKNLGMLAIGNVYLDLNKSKKDVLGDGKVSYDAERHTLTLNNATIETEQNAMYMQEAGDLIIEVVGDCEIKSNKKTAIMLFYDSHVTITGSGKLTINSPENCGIYLLYSNLLTIKNVNMEINGRWAIAGLNGQSGETVELINTKLNANGWQSGISSLEKITLTQTKLISPTGATWNETERCYMHEGQRVKNLIFDRQDEPSAVNGMGHSKKITITSNGAIVRGMPGQIVQIYSKDGRMVHCFSLPTDGTCHIDLTDLCPDLYIIVLNETHAKIIIK